MLSLLPTKRLFICTTATRLDLDLVTDAIALVVKIYFGFRMSSPANQLGRARPGEQWATNYNCQSFRDPKQKRHFNSVLSIALKVQIKNIVQNHLLFW